MEAIRLANLRPRSIRFSFIRGYMSIVTVGTSFRIMGMVFSADCAGNGMLSACFHVDSST